MSNGNPARPRPWVSSNVGRVFCLDFRSSPIETMRGLLLPYYEWLDSSCENSTQLSLICRASALGLIGGVINWLEYASLS